MESNILKKKKEIEVEGIIFIDLISQNFTYENDGFFFIVDYFNVPDLMEMRPDIMSYYVFGDIDYWDLLLKYNGISNPFALSVEDTIVVPDLEWLTNCVIDSESREDFNLEMTSQYSMSDEKYQRILNKLKEINSDAVFRKEFLPPNILDTKGGEDIIDIKDGKIILGGKIYGKD